jgi:chemotaxis protein MotB
VRPPGSVEPLQPLPRRARTSGPKDHPNHERWLVSYADFVTLLFAFFTVLYASATLDAKKLHAVVASLDQAFQTRGAGEATSGAVSSAGAGPRVATATAPDLADLRASLAARLATPIGQRWVDVALDHRGVVISIREGGSFAAGSADPSPAAQVVLRDVATILAGVDNPVRVEGHTDDVPIHTARFASNWDLSTARATQVVQRLLAEGTIHPDRISAAGYAEFHPRVANTSASDRAQNRRVDLVILSAATQAAEDAALPLRGNQPSR